MAIKALRISVYKNQKAFELKQPSIKVGISCSACRQKSPYCANNATQNYTKCLFTSELAQNMQLPIKSMDENGVRRVSIVMDSPREISNADNILQRLYKKYSR